jgi:hypothetical protein
MKRKVVRVAFLRTNSLKGFCVLSMSYTDKTLVDSFCLVKTMLKHVF